MGEQELVFGSCVHRGVSISWEHSLWDLWALCRPGGVVSSRGIPGAHGKVQDQSEWEQFQRQGCGHLFKMGGSTRVFELRRNPGYIQSRWAPGFEVVTYPRDLLGSHQRAYLP